MDGTSPPSNRTGSRPGTTTTAHRPGSQQSNGYRPYYQPTRVMEGSLQVVPAWRPSTWARTRHLFDRTAGFPPPKRKGVSRRAPDAATFEDRQRLATHPSGCSGAHEAALRSAHSRLDPCGFPVRVIKGAASTDGAICTLNGSRSELMKQPNAPICFVGKGVSYGHVA